MKTKRRRRVDEFFDGIEGLTESYVEHRERVIRGDSDLISSESSRPRFPKVAIAGFIILIGGGLFSYRFGFTWGSYLMLACVFAVAAYSGMAWYGEWRLGWRDVPNLIRIGLALFFFALGWPIYLVFLALGIQAYFLYLVIRIFVGSSALAIPLTGFVLFLLGAPLFALGLLLLDRVLRTVTGWM